MSTPINDGGPAFPCHTNPLPGKLANALQGMTLRDWFAGQALASSFAAILPHFGKGTNPKEYAESLYQMADAMIAAREAKP